MDPRATTLAVAVGPPMPHSDRAGCTYGRPNDGTCSHRLIPVQTPETVLIVVIAPLLSMVLTLSPIHASMTIDDNRRQSTTIDDNRRQSTTTPDLSPVGSLRCDPCILCIDARSTSLYNNLFSVNSNNSSKKCCLLSSLSSPWLVCVSSDARADFPPWICCSRFLRVAFSTFAVASARRTTMKDRIFVADRSETFVFLSESATYLIPEVAEFTPTRSSNSPHSHALSVL